MTKVSKIEQEIEQLVLPSAGQQFKGNDFRQLREPGVYVLLSNGIPLYVGMGSMLLRRVGGKHGQADKAINECDQLLIYPCISTKAAAKLETILISKLQPKYNWRKRSIVLRELGYAPNSCSAIQHQKLARINLS